jgi:hypothetical protein
MAKKKPQRRAVRGSRNLLDLPQATTVWQADVCRSPAWINIAGNMHRPWLVLVTNRTDDLVLAHEMLDREPTAQILWDKLTEAMRTPLAGLPERPGVLQVRSEELRCGLGTRLQPLGIECVVAELDQLDFVLQELAKHLHGGHCIPAVLDAPGIRPAQIRAYFEAAANFYRRKPWHSVPGDTPIKVECSRVASSPWYAVVMGQLGETFGLALYEGFDALARILQSDMPEGEARNSSAVSLIYGERHEISARDLDALEEHGWPVAAPEAYPLTVRINPGCAVRVPLVWELELVAACLWAIPTSWPMM